MTRIGRPRNTLEDVWKQIDCSDPDGCWPWVGYKNQSGYGRITIGYEDRLAHRVVYELEHGDFGDLIILHHCDNPPCCRPDHLYAGTYQDNANDRENRNRTNYQRGEKHHSAKLSDAEVSEIRMRWGAGEKQKDLADEYRISRAQVSRIINGTRRR